MTLTDHMTTNQDGAKRARGQVLVTWTNGAQVVLDDDDRDLHLLREFIARVETCTRRAA